MFIKVSPSKKLQTVVASEDKEVIIVCPFILFEFNKYRKSTFFKIS
jgi:hypothetical protein